MNLPLRTEGQITVELHWTGRSEAAAISAVGVQSSRRVMASKLLAGRDIEHAVPLVQALFSVCGRSQACACATAIENACGAVASAETQVLRRAAVDMETLREHLWRIFLDWPKHLGLQPQRQALALVLQLQQEFELAFGDIHRWFVPQLSAASVHSATVDSPSVDYVAINATLKRLESLIGGQLLGGTVAGWRALHSHQQMRTWLATTSGRQRPVAVAMLGKIEESGWSAAGQGAVEALSLAGETSLGTLVQRLQSWDFIARPEWLGEPRESSSLMRNHTPLLTDLRETCGTGLLTRAAALVSEVVALLQRLQGLFTERGLAWEAWPATHAGSALPVGLVNAARGQLLHWLQLQGSTITDYRILAPTEWNFHPRGVVARSLQSLRGSVSAIHHQAALLIELVDPCVGYQLTLREAEASHA